ncbi:hypothetical protein Ga0100231_013535 [Opitutaceae bacterium TAV4]|nr:hypothetical protein Ga0100231_013535 [Opitutaceae bacterium TAV4]RRJ99430.1 hypothetical protein Ga0100230_014840 [Opitutaceae bacterium TAV3]
MDHYSDEPVLVKPTSISKWGLRQWVLTGIGTLVLLIAAAFIATPFYQKHLDHKAHEVKRGEMWGAIYDTEIEGVVSTVELAWPGQKLAVIVRPSPIAGAVMQIDGSFGSERLTWDAQHSAFGPTQATLNPLDHYKVKLTLRRDGREVWSGKFWAYGAVQNGGHGH